MKIKMDNGDGEIETTLEQLIIDNNFEQDDPEYAEEIKNDLNTNGIHYFGGGAAPLIELRKAD